MPSLSVKDVPEDLLERLRARAKRNHRSLQGELLDILEQAARHEETGVRDLREYVRGLDLHTPDEATSILRSDRDRR